MLIIYLFAEHSIKRCQKIIKHTGGTRYFSKSISVGSVLESNGIPLLKHKQMFQTTNQGPHSITYDILLHTKEAKSSKNITLKMSENISLGKEKAN